MTEDLYEEKEDVPVVEVTPASPGKVLMLEITQGQQDYRKTTGHHAGRVFISNEQLTWLKADKEVFIRNISYTEQFEQWYVNGMIVIITDVPGPAFNHGD